MTGNKVTRSVRAYKKLWEEAKRRALNDGKTISSVINKFLADYTEKDIDEPRGEPFLSHSELSDKRKKIVRLLIKEGVLKIDKKTFFSWVKDKNIYSRMDYIKSAVRDISRDKVIPYNIEGENIVAKEFECYCGARLSVKALSNLKGECPSCQTKLINLDVGTKGFKVLDQ